LSRNYFQNVFAVSGRQLAMRVSRALRETVRITESAMKMATPTKTTAILYPLANSPSPQ
jgi:hypothetical protein